MTTVATEIQIVFLEHETNYVSRPIDSAFKDIPAGIAWTWSCKCGKTLNVADREACMALTREHWAQVISEMFGRRVEPNERNERKLGDLVAEGVNLTICALDHMHYSIRHGDYKVHATFRGKEEPSVDIEKR
jgi:hypothetical protein